MRLLARLVLAIVVAISIGYFVFWIVGAFMPHEPSLWIPTLIALLGAIGAGWFVSSSAGAGTRSLISSVVLGAVVLGGIGFAIGFFGPLIVAPGANQGPLLGIFLTGPLGFLIGGLVGFGYWWSWRRDAHRPPAHGQHEGWFTRK